MPVPADIFALSQTPASNSPPGTESPTSADDYLRFASSCDAVLRDGKGFAAAVSLASGATTDIGAVNSLFVEVSGTTTITSFGTTYKGPRFLRFTGALVLTHAAALNLPGAANITTAAGDTLIAIPNQAATGWNVYFYQPAALFVGPTALAGRTALGFTSPVIDRAYAEYTTNADLATTIPLDDTIPQNTEGTQVVSASITPKSTTNRVRVRFQCEAISNTAAVNAIAALFVNAGVSAVRANYATTGGAGFATPIILEYEHVPGATSAQTYAVRVGAAAGTIRLNGTGTARTFGGAMAATIVVEEIAA